MTDSLSVPNQGPLKDRMNQTPHPKAPQRPMRESGKDIATKRQLSSGPAAFLDLSPEALRIIAQGRKN